MKYRMMLLVIPCLVILSANVLGQYKEITDPQASTAALTGNLHYDLSNGFQQDGLFDSTDIQRDDVYKKKYSPLRAALYSAILPGAGQFYTKSYWQSAAFFGSEVLAWVLYASYENEGDQKTDEFQNYADEHWSVVQYASWINANFSRSLNTNPVDWSDLNKAEWEIGGGDPAITQPTGFTHQLAHYGEQQYYEMIGKYAQFGGGWDDAATFKPGGYTTGDVTSGNVSPNFLKYSAMRGDANNFYNIATTVSYLIVVNHVLSAVEAAWNASKINHRIQLEGHIQSRRIYGNIVEFVPTLHVKYEL